ncbi:MAG: hypothetical protein CL607_00260 [Anaerolineaceae bacterium]|nr:hypothetical protein [Anaerolineaceae bacterium]
MDGGSVNTEIQVQLGLPEEAVIRLLDLEVGRWGRDFVFAAQAAANEASVILFKLAFYDCSETRWQTYTHIDLAIDAPLPTTTLVSYKLGRDQQRSPARLLTEHFGLSTFYGELVIQQS